MFLDDNYSRCNNYTAVTQSFVCINMKVDNYLAGTCLLTRCGPYMYYYVCFKGSSVRYKINSL